MINYNNRTFRAVSNTDNGETSILTVFYYKQEGNTITAVYSGGKIVTGQIIGTVDEKGNIDMRYQQINTEGESMTGKCISQPEILENGKIRLYENWEWTSGDKSKGKSIIEEV